MDIKLGYSAMFATKSMEILKGGDHTKYQNWAWVLITFRPEFLNATKNK